MIRCGSQCLSCDYPIHFDTYEGCGHGCKYCYVKHKYSIDNIKAVNTIKSLKNFIEGGRNFETKWCDWNIPLHWGANSDPFQPCEKELKSSLKCLEILADSQYPFIVSTKNPVMLTEQPYLDLISRCNCVLQVSMACSKYDKMETGCPPYAERLKAVKVLSDKVKRIIIRVRPYFPDCHKDILNEIKNYAKAGAYAISISAFYSIKKQNGMKRYGNSYQFDNDYLYPRYKQLKAECHKQGIQFLCCESGLDHMGDSLDCCGCGGLDGFTANKFNVAHIAYEDEVPTATESMKANDTFQPFKGIGQNQIWAKKCIGKSFEQLMYEVGGNQIEWLREQKERYGEGK